MRRTEMEKIEMFRNSKKYGFKAGDTFPVLRDINGRCVVITAEDKPNIIWSEGKARSYGRLSGEPQMV